MTKPTAAARLLASDAFRCVLGPNAAPDERVVSGNPVTSTTALPSWGTTRVGVWAMTPGTVTDVEDDETFVVLSGIGSVTFADGSMIGLAPGTVAQLVRGDRTTWTVTETIRKVYVS